MLRCYDRHLGYIQGSTDSLTTPFVLWNCGHWSLSTLFSSMYNVRIWCPLYTVHCTLYIVHIYPYNGLIIHICTVVHARACYHYRIRGQLMAITQMFCLYSHILLFIRFTIPSLHHTRYNQLIAITHTIHIGCYPYPAILHGSQFA